MNPKGRKQFVIDFMNIYQGLGRDILLIMDTPTV